MGRLNTPLEPFSSGRFIMFTQSFSNDVEKHLFYHHKDIYVRCGEALIALYDAFLSDNNLEGVRC